MPTITAENFDQVVKILDTHDPREWTVWCFQVAVVDPHPREGSRYSCTHGIGVPVLSHADPGLLSKWAVDGPDLVKLRSECERAWAQGCDTVLACRESTDAWGVRVSEDADLIRCRLREAEEGRYACSIV